MKVDYIFIHSITWISTTHITKNLINKTHFVYTVLICNKVHKAFYISVKKEWGGGGTQVKLDIATQTFIYKRSETVKYE